jgi:hypothetical protein
MLDFPYIAGNLRGVWLMMLGRREGLALLDVSADGFWRSFQAILLALPGLVLSWFSHARDLSGLVPLSSGAIVFRSALVETAAWFIPIIIFSLLAKPFGVSARFTHFVVANNWLSVFFSYAVLLLAPFDLLGPGFDELALIVALLILLLSLVMFFRVTHIALGSAWQTSSAMFLIVILVSLPLIFSIEGALGISYPAQPPG